MPDRTRYAIIGTGWRAGMYVEAILGEHAHVAELVALVDRNPGRMERYRLRAEDRLPGDAPSTWPPEQLEAAIAHGGVERVIVTTPDHTHAAFVARALRAGADVVVEKPLTIDEAGSRLIANAVSETGRNVVMTFNYRYAPRNSAFKRLIASGEIGIPLSVHFEWVLDTSHGADYFRRWHRDKANSGGLLVHKASHHFDLVNWWLDDVPSRVFASGGLRFYGHDNARRDGRDAEYERGTGRDAADPFALDLRTDAGLTELYLDTERHDGYLRDRNVFGTGITIEDNLSLVVDYGSGASMSYSLNAHSPWEGYRIAVNGTKGRAEMEVVERGAVLLAPDARTVIDPSAVVDTARAEGVRPRGERILLQRHWQAPEVVPIEHGEGGHGGGDAILLHDVFVGPSADPLHRAATWHDGLRAVAVGIAGNRSLASGLPVRISDLDLGAPLAFPVTDAAR